MHTVKFFQILLSNTNNSIKHQPFVYIQLNDQIVLFQTIQFSISHLFALILNVKQFYLTHRKDLTGATTPGQSEPRSDANEGVHHIPLSFGIREASPSDSLVSYPGHSLEESYISTEMQLVYSTAPAAWTGMERKGKQEKIKCKSWDKKKKKKEK